MDLGHAGHGHARDLIKVFGQSYFVCFILFILD